MAAITATTINTIVLVAILGSFVEDGSQCCAVNYGFPPRQ